MPTPHDPNIREICVDLRTEYGTERIYPVCTTAQIFASIAGTKTLTRQAIRDIKRLGYRIDVVKGII